MGRPAGSLCRFVCTVCGETEMVRGGTLYFRCSKCRPARTAQEAAHSAVAVAIRKGQLAHPSNFACEDCGEVASQYDHRDYSKPLEVAPVCAGCNVRRGPAINHSARPVGRPRGAYKWQKPAAWRLAQAAQSGVVCADEGSARLIHAANSLASL
jgi:hypothetical protein